MLTYRYNQLLKSKNLLECGKFRQFHCSSLSNLELPDKHKTIEKFHFKHFTHTINDIDSNYKNLLDQPVTINGWIDGAPRKISKTLVFAKFRDFNGEFTQIVTKSEEWSKILRTLKPEDSLSVTGKVNVKKQKKGSENEIAETWELNVDNFQILNDSNEKATQLDSLKETPNQYPPEYRYLQLRLPYYQNALKMRAHAARVARSVLDSMNFTEIETPLLFKSTPEGAKEFLVPTRKTGFFYALPQSPQQYKQLLMASGFKGYYQIAKCFRDEDLRADRQPEFTQIDMEMSFGRSEDIQKVVQNLISRIWKDVKGLPLYRVDWDTGKLVELKDGENFPKLNYQTALSKFGIDKPDLRSTLTFQNLNNCFNGILKNSEFPIIEGCVLKGGLKKVKKLPKQLFDDLEYKGRKPFIFKIRNEEELHNWANKLPVELKISVNDLNLELGLEVNDIVAIGDRSELSYENPTPLGRFRQLAIQYFPAEWRREIAEGSSKQELHDIFVASWLVDFPLFSPIELDASGDGYPRYDFQKFESTHHPFTMAKLEDYDYLANDPLKVKGDHYDLVINGVEVGGGSRRIHDAELQKFIFSEILQIKNHMTLFGHLIHALDSGCPPHAGLAIGFDRMCSMLVGSSNIRDVVAFPKTQAGADPVVESPSNVPAKTLDLYGISVNK
jgi:aspartyl-tRNA synthetase